MRVKSAESIYELHMGGTVVKLVNNNLNVSAFLRLPFFCTSFTVPKLAAELSFLNSLALFNRIIVFAL